ncbi:hypothetical protein CLOP_g16023 [Closterium sp. NIES-67]|nr:hypothetical protein CLOP_g16023 [Closterium sp. NIES-67]
MATQQPPPTEPGRLAKLVVPTLEKIIKNASWRKHQRLVQDCKGLIEWFAKNPTPGTEWQPPAQDPPGYVNPFDESASRGGSSHSGSSGGAFPAGLFDDGNRVLKIKDAEFIMAPLHTACETLAAKVVEPTLDCLQKMVAHQHLRGEMDVGGTTRESKLLTRVMESVCKCYDIADEAVELLVLKTMLSAVTSTSLRVHGECVLKAVRTCYNIYLGSKVPVNQTTAKASLTQMLVIVFRRMEADSSTVPVQPIVVADLMEPSDRLASDQNVTQFVQSFITKVVQDIEVAFNPAHSQSLDDGAFDLAVTASATGAAAAGSLVEDKDMLDVKYWDVNMLAGAVTDPTKSLGGGDGKVVTVKAGATLGSVATVPAGSSANGGVNPAGAMTEGGGVIIPDVDPEKEGDSEVKITNKLRRDAFLVFRALCKLSMKAPPAEGVVDPFAVRGKVVSLELLKICLENSGAVFRTNERFVGAVKQYLCLSLLKNCTSSLMSVFQLSCSIFFSLLTRFRSVLKAEIGVFFPMIVLRVLENVAHANFQQKMIVLRFLERLCVDPQILVDIFANYDCDVESTVSIFERMVSGLLKTAQGVPPGADSTLNAAQDQQLRLAAIKCMVGVLRSMGSWTNRQLCVTAGPKVAAEIGAAAAAAAAASAAAAAAAAAAASAAGEGGAAAPVAVPDLLSGDLLPDFVNPKTAGLPVVRSEEGLEEEGLGGVPGAGQPGVNSGNEISEAAILEQRRAYKLELQEGINLFNKKPKKGIDFLIKAKKLGEGAEEIVAFLRKTEGLDKTMIGDFLGDRDDMSIKIMHAYMDSYNLSGMDFDEAIRSVLLGFRLPGEAQKIDRIMEKFAERYCRCNPKAFTSADTAYVLAYSVIMLNTDAHNPGVKSKMSKADFLKNNRGIDDGKDIPEEFLGGLYDRITRNEIKMKPELLGAGGAAAKAAAASSAAGGALLGLESILNLMSGRTRATTDLETSDEVVRHMQEQFRAKAGKSGSVFYAASDVQIIRPMVDVVWAPMLAAFSVPLETTEEETVTEQCLEGFRYAVHVTAVIGMQMQRDAFVTSLAKFTSLHSAADIKQKNVDAIKAVAAAAAAGAGGAGGAGGGDADAGEEGGAVAKRPMTLAEAVGDVRCKIAVQLLLVQAMTEIFSMHGASLSAPHTLVLLDSLHLVGTHAHAINSDRLLRSRLQALHLATQMPDPPLLRLESEALHAYLSLLQRLPREKAQLAKEVDVELRLVILCEEVLRVYVGTSQGKLTLMTDDPRGADAPPLPPIPLAVPLGSARRRELVARAPLVVATLQAVTALKDAAFKKHLARFFPLLADLVSSEHGSPEIQVALSKMFSSRIGPIVFSVAE